MRSLLDRRELAAYSKAVGKIKAVIFDCDGVLVDSEELGNRLLVRMAEEHGYQPDLGAALAAFKGVCLERCMKMIESEIQAALPTDFAGRFRAKLLEELEVSLAPVEGIETVLSSLTVPICVASGAPLKKILYMLGRFDLLRYFGGKIYSSYELNLWKPAPDLFLHAARELGFAPSEVGVVEDSPPGVEAGLAAGMRVFNYLPGATQTESGSLTVFGRMSELPKLLDLHGSNSLKAFQSFRPQMIT